MGNYLGAQGSKRTVEFCEKHNKAWLHIDLEVPHLIMLIKSTDPSPFSDRITEWLQKEDLPTEIVLNVAGSRGTKAPMIQQTVWIIMRDLLNITNGFRLYEFQDEG